MLTIRNLCHNDIDSAIVLQSRVYPSISPFRQDQFETCCGSFRADSSPRN